MLNRVHDKGIDLTDNRATFGNVCIGVPYVTLCQVWLAGELIFRLPATKTSAQATHWSMFR